MELHQDLRYESLTLMGISQQLNLFEKDKEMNESALKYPRRKSRVIANKKYVISAPTDMVSNTMKSIPSTGTKIEQIFEAELIASKINYTTPEYLIEPIEGKPDFVIPKYRIAIFCDGDFWHGRNFEKGKIKSNSDFWDAKIERNILRDSEVTYELKKKDWVVFRFWEADIKKNASKCVKKITDYISKNFKAIHQFTFVDLFSGIGGFRIPLEQLGGKCLGFSEINKQSSEVYKRNFYGFKDENEIELGDITKLGRLPFTDIDLIVGGVPCQAWSVAGKMKGFDDPRGQLWLDTIRVVSLNQPKAFIFENVKGLIDPRNKANLDLIKSQFEDIGYSLKEPRLLNSYDFGLPQNRDRIFIVGVRKDLKKYIQKFEYPTAINKHSFLAEFVGDNKNVALLKKKKFDPQAIFGDKVPMGRNRFQQINELNDFFIFCDTRNGHTTIHSWDIVKTSKREKEICMSILRNRRKKIYGDADGNPISFKALTSLNENLKESELKALVKKKILKFVDNKGYDFINSKNSSGINGIYRIYLPNSKVFSTLTATGTRDMVAMTNIEGGSPEEYKEQFINQVVKKKLYREITAREAAKLQGFPDWFSIHKDPNVAKKQFGNAVSTSVILHLSKNLICTGVFK